MFLLALVGEVLARFMSLRVPEPHKVMRAQQANISNAMVHPRDEDQCWHRAEEVSVYSSRQD